MTFALPTPVTTDALSGPTATRPSRWSLSRSGLALGSLAVLGLAAWVRVIGQASIGLASDEAVYAGQAASIAGDASRAALFSLFRAHPVLVQLLLGAVYRVGGVSDVNGRLFVALAFGVGTVALVMLLARRVYGPAVALVAGAVLAVLPYHVLVTRQVLLDGPMTFFVVLAIVCAERAATRGSELAFVGAATFVGFATLTKETAILAGPAILLALIISRKASAVGRRSTTLAIIVGALLVAPFLLSRLLRSHNAGQTLLWQLTRPPNHSTAYFGTILLAYVGPALLLLALVGIVIQIRRHTGGDIVILIPAAIFGIFHQMWPTKLLPYLVVMTPAIAIAAAVAVVATAGALTRRRSKTGRTLAGVLLVALLLPAAVASSDLRHPADAHAGRIVDVGPPVATFAGGREVGRWVSDHTPVGSRFMTIGPSLGNIVAFYGDRPFVALSVSPDPAKRNPAYVPVPNPDLALRTGAVDYIVWDAYSAARSRFSGDRALRYARRYHGVPVLSVVREGRSRRTIDGAAPDDAEVLAIVYSVRSGDPGEVTDSPAP
ncbi:MAG TPA: glycosyltransferase family 39 protein [Acidimicrobiales bacterium]|nr:glycosyltransferase family 39 protein [Acidimicrobiales bacterium]